MFFSINLPRHIVDSCCSVKYPKIQSLYIKIAAIIDLSSPILILVLGILGALSIMHFSPTASWAMITTGGTLLFLTITTCTLLALRSCKKKPIEIPR